MRYQYKNGEKLTRFSIRKYHFGAASVAVASLIFFGGVSAKAENIPTSENAQASGKSADGSSSGDKNSKLDDKSTSVQDKSTIIEKTADVVATVKVDKAELKKLTISLDTLFRTTEKDKIASIYDEVSQSISEAKLVLDKDTASAEEVNAQVAKLTEITKKLKETIVKADKTTEKVKEQSRQVDEKKPVDNKANTSEKTDKNSEPSTSGKKESDNQKSTAPDKGKLETLAKSLDVYLKSASEITRPETKELLKGVEETVLAVKKGLENPQLTASEIEELIKQGKQAEKKLALAVSREHSGKRDSLTGNKMLPDSYFRANYYRAADGKVYDSHGDERLTEATVGYITKANDGSGYPPGTFLYISNNDNNAATGRNNPYLGPQPVKRLKQQVFAEVTKQSDGYHWKITFNNARESRQNPIYYFTVPEGQSVRNMKLIENGAVKKQGGVAEVFNGASDKYLTSVGSPDAGVHGTPYYENVANTQNAVVGNRGGIYGLDDFVKNNTEVYFNRNGMTAEDITVTNKLYDKIKSSTQNVFAFRPRDFDIGNTYVVEFDTVGDTEAPLYYIAGMKSYEKIPTGRFMHKSYQQWYGVQERYNITVDTSRLKTTFLKGTGIGTLDTKAGLASSAVTIEDTYTSTRFNPGAGDIGEYNTYKSTGNYSKDYYKQFHNRFVRDFRGGEDGINVTADRSKGNHTLYIEADVRNQRINFRLPYKVVTQSDIYQPVVKAATGVKDYTGSLGSASDYITEYRYNSVPGFKEPDSYDMGTPSEGLSFYKDRIFDFPKTSARIKEQSVKSVEWAGGTNDLTTGTRVIELTVDGSKKLFKVPYYIDVVPGGTISAENVEKLNAAIREAYQKVDTNGNVSGTVPTVTSTTPVWVQKQIKVTYYDNENNARTNNQDDSVDYVDVLFKQIRKEATPTVPTISVPEDGSASVTPKGTTDKLVVSYRPTDQNADTIITVKKSGTTWGTVDTLPNGVILNPSNGVVSITEPTVKDLSTITAKATYLNSDEASATDTVKTPDNVAPTVSFNGKALTEDADATRFIIYRGANFNPTFRVQDNKNNVNLSITGLPKGVANVTASGNNDYNYTIPENAVATDAPFGESTATVVATDARNNSATYKFKYRIVDIQAKNSTTEDRAVGSELGDPQNHFKVAESNTAENDKYYPNNMQFKWKELNSRTFQTTDVANNTKLNELGTITKYIATAAFPNTVNTKSIDGVNYTIYTPTQKAVQMTFNVTDTITPTVKMTNPTNNTESVLGSDENNLPVVEVFRGATLNIPLKMFDNNTNGKINIKHISGLPTGVNLNSGNVLSQNSGSEANPATATITGRVVANATLGTSTVTLKVSDDATGSVDKGNQATLKFKVKTYDLAFEDRGTRVDDNTRSDVLGLNAQSLDPNHYLAITDGTNITNDWGSGMVFRYLKGNNEIRETVSFDKIGKHSVKARAYFPNSKTSTKGLPTNPTTGLTGDTASVAGRGYLEKTVEFNVKPNTPTISQPQFYGTASSKPTVTVENLPTTAQLQNGATVTVELYQGTTKVASKTVTDRNGTTTLSAENFTANLTEGQQVHAVVKVSGGQGTTAYSVNSDNSENRNVTGRSTLSNLATDKLVVQVQDFANNRRGILSEAEKNTIKQAIFEANKNGVLRGKQVSDINISDTGLITALDKDNKIAELQINPNTGVVTRFAHIRNDYNITFTNNGKPANRSTDPGFEWSGDGKSLIYKFDATSGVALQTNEVLKTITATPKNAQNQPSLTTVTGNDKALGEANSNGFSRNASTGYFSKNGVGVNVLDLVNPTSYAGGGNISNTGNKLVDINHGDVNGSNIIGTNLETGTTTITGANGSNSITLNNVVKGRSGNSLIEHKQLYLMPKYTDGTLLTDRGTTATGNTNVINVYFVPVDPRKPEVSRPATSSLAATKEAITNAQNVATGTNGKISSNFLTSKVDVRDNYDSPAQAKAKLEMYVQKDGENTRTKVVTDNNEDTDALSAIVRAAEQGNGTSYYKVIAKTSDRSGNVSEEAVVGWFKVEEKGKPTVKLVGDDGSDTTLSESTPEANLPKVTVYRGEKANVTIKASDNTGKIKELRGSGMPNGIWFNKNPNADSEVWLSSDNATETNPLSHTITGVVEKGNRIEEKTVTISASDKTDPSNMTTVKFKMVVKEQKDKYTPTAGTTVTVGNIGTISQPDGDKIKNAVTVPNLSTEATRDGITKTLKDNGAVTTQNGKKYVTVEVTYPDGSKDEVPVEVQQNHTVVKQPVINLVQGETLTAAELKQVVKLQDGNSTIDLPSDAQVTAQFNSTTAGDNKTLTATVRFADNTSKTVELTYRVLPKIKVAETIYDFKGAADRHGDFSTYRENKTLPSGVTANWTVKKTTEAQGQDANQLPTLLKKDPVGTTTYTVTANYNVGRFTNNETNAANQLKQESTLTHKVFSITENESNTLTVSQGTRLTEGQAKQVVKLANGSEALPTGTTYQWITVGTSDVANKSGENSYQVKVILPKSQVGTDAPAATQEQPSNIVTPVVNVTPPKPTIQADTITSTTRTISGTLGGFAVDQSAADKKVVEVHLNDAANTVLSSKRGEVTINGDNWSVTLPEGVKIRQSQNKNGETTQPSAITVVNKVDDTTLSTTSDGKAVEMGGYSVNTTIAGSKHVDVTVPHDAKRIELRFHNSEESGNTTNSIVLVRGTDGTWHTDAIRADNTAVTNANGYVGTISSTVSTTNPAENNIRIELNEESGSTKLHIKEESANGDNTESYGSGLGLRVYNQPEAGQDPSATGKWKVVGVTNNNPTLSYKGREASNVDTRKVFPSGTSITKATLEDLVTVGDREDKVTNEADRPYGTPTIKIVSGLTETPGRATASGSYVVVLKAVDSQGKESDPLTVYVGVVSTDVKYQPQVNGENLGTAKNIPVSEGTHHQGEEVSYTPESEIRGTDGKVYVPTTTGPQSVHLTDQPQTINVTYVEKQASTELKYQPQVNGENLGTAKNIPVSEGTHHQGEEVSYTPESEIRGTDGKVYVPTTTGPQSVHLTDQPQTINVTYVEKQASTTVSYQPKVGTEAKGNPIAITVPTDKTHQGDSVSYTPKEITVDGKVYKPVTPGAQTVTLTDNPQTVDVAYVEDFTPVKPTEKVTVKDKAHLTPEEKKQVEDKVKAKNPGKNVTVGDDGTATVTDPTTGISHTIPGTELVNQDFEPVKPTEKVTVKDKGHLTPEEKKQVEDKVKAKNPGKNVTVGDDGTATVTDPTTGISHTIPGTELVNQDFEPVIPTDKIPVKDPVNLTQEEQNKVKESVEKVNPGKKVTVDKTGKVTITDPNTNISHEIPGEKLITLEPPVVDIPEYTDPIGTTGVDENGNLIEPPIKHQTKLIITKWVDEKGNELKPADAKAPKVLGEANEAFEAGEIEGYAFVRTETKGDVVTHIFRKVTATKPQPIPTLPEVNENIKQTPTGKVEKSTKRLANTGESETNTGLAGLGLAVLGSLLAVAKRRREDEE